MNALQQYLDMYDSQMGNPGNAYVQAPRNAISQLGAVRVRDDNAGARRLMFAGRMMGREQGGQDFFGGNQVPMPQMEQRPMRQASSHHGSPQIANYLAQLMGRG